MKIFVEKNGWKPSHIGEKVTDGEMLGQDRLYCVFIKNHKMYSKIRQSVMTVQCTDGW